MAWTLGLLGASQASFKIVATGGTITTVGGFKIHTFNSSGTFTVTSAPAASKVEYLVIAGGGGAGQNGTAQCGGGGAGGYRSSVVGELSGRLSAPETLMTIGPGNYSVTLGAGGVGATSSARPTNGNNSTFGVVTSIGGGRGGTVFSLSWEAPGSGGSAGGASPGGQASGTAGQGFDSGAWPGGSNGGGGAGAGENGNTDGQGHGGDGISSSVTGSAVTRAGGGAAQGGLAGLGGGGEIGSAGTVGTGGGGGTPGSGNTAFAGGSGVVIIRYAA